MSEGEPLARKSPGALAALARRLLRAATDLATRSFQWDYRNRLVTIIDKDAAGQLEMRKLIPVRFSRLETDY